MSTCEPTLANLVVTNPSILNTSTELPFISESFGAAISPNAGCKLRQANITATRIILLDMT
jgi:hypothetical protein